MTEARPDERRHPSGGLTLPARVGVRCRQCGYERAMLVLHDEAFRRAQVCERCRGSAEVVSASAAHGFGCPCCF